MVMAVCVRQRETESVRQTENRQKNIVGHLQDYHRVLCQVK